jgi:hypothetical protein
MVAFRLGTYVLYSTLVLLLFDNYITFKKKRLSFIRRLINQCGLLEGSDVIHYQDIR